MCSGIASYSHHQQRYHLSSIKRFMICLHSDLLAFCRSFLLHVPQLTQWRQFEEDMNPHPSHMAKYFSSKSLRSSENDLYDLLGEYDSMKRLISEVRVTSLTLWTSCITDIQQSGSDITHQAFKYKLRAFKSSKLPFWVAKVARYFMHLI